MVTLDPFERAVVINNQLFRSVALGRGNAAYKITKLYMLKITALDLIFACYELSSSDLELMCRWTDVCYFEAVRMANDTGRY